MTAQKGRDLLLKLDTTGAGVFQTVAGLRANAICLQRRKLSMSPIRNPPAPGANCWRAPA